MNHNENAGFGASESDFTGLPKPGMRAKNYDTLEEMARISERIMNVRARLAKIETDPRPAYDDNFILIYNKDGKLCSSAFKTTNEAINFGGIAMDDDQLFALCVIDKIYKKIVWSHFLVEENELNTQLDDFLALTPIE